MKTYKIVLSLIFVSLAFFTGCDDDSPTKEEKFIRRLRYTWNLQNVMLGAKDVTNSFPGMSLTLNGRKTYSVTNPVDPIWPEKGIFKLEKVPNSDLFNIIRDDGIYITVTELTATTLKYKFEYVALGGKTKSVSGDYEFSMTR